LNKIRCWYSVIKKVFVKSPVLNTIYSFLPENFFYAHSDLNVAINVAFFGMLWQKESWPKASFLKN
jgi:hypothetical protein